MFLLSNKALIRVGEGVKEKPPEPMSDGWRGELWYQERPIERW